jgi:hypothetical protein
MNSTMSVVDAYIAQLSPIELEALEIAKRMLTAFRIETTIGFLKFKKTYHPV